MTGRAQNAFTLIELLIALAIFSVMSVASYVGLQNFLSMRASLEAHESVFSEVQSAVLLIESDVENLVARPIRDELGDRVPALISRGQMDVGLSRLRPGLPIEFEPSDLLRVNYYVEQNQLIRRTWSVLDRTPGTAYQDRVLLSDIAAVEWRFLSGSWLNYWPQNNDPVSIQQLPRAVEVTITLGDGRVLNRLMRVVNEG